MKWAIYNILFAAVYPFLLPGFLLRMLKRGGYAARMGDRFALYPKEVLAKLMPDGKPVCGHGESRTANHEPRTSDYVWIHAVSVGEVQVAGQLMREWRKVEPSVRFCFSTTSSTGWKIAERELAALRSQSSISTPDLLIYNPLDFPNFVKSALKTVRPRAIVLTESEIWPNFILRAKMMGIPLFLINARVSDRSAPRYKFAHFFFRDVFGAFTKIFAQSDLDAARIRAAMGRADAAALPCESKDNVVVTGSFKFDVAKRNEAKEVELKKWIFGDEKESARKVKILLGGSTWPGEDKVLLDVYRSILQLQLDTSTLLVLAPRHFEKADEVEANIRAAGFACIRRSRGESFSTQSSTSGLPPVYLCDTTGEMMGLFGICDVAFVGKSLCAHGSQNMIEPCLCGKPTFVGPFTENFRPVMSDLLAADAIVQVKDAAELKARIVELMSGAACAGFSREVPSLGDRAKAAVLNRQGVVPRCVTAIRDALTEQGLKSPRRKDCKMKNSWLKKGLIIAAVFAVFAVVVIGVLMYLGRTPEKELPKPEACPVVSNVIEVISHVFAPDGDIIRLDVRKFTCREFQDRLCGVSDAATLWTPGEGDWLVVGAKNGCTNTLTDVMEAFNNESTAFSFPEVFANCVGTVGDIRAAFEVLNPNDGVVPELFVTKEIPEFDWLWDVDINREVAASIRQELRSMQVVRRVVLEGVILSRQQKEDEAIAKWASAFRRTPNDTLLLERMDHLRRNAEVFYKVGKYGMASKCYETLLRIKPDDYVSAVNLGACLKALGKPELAAAVFKKAETIVPKGVELPKM